MSLEIASNHWQIVSGYRQPKAARAACCPPVAHYIRSEATFDGIVVPTKRHIHPRNEARTPVLSFPPITLDLSDVKVTGRNCGPSGYPPCDDPPRAP